jgi:hypothetical protein
VIGGCVRGRGWPPASTVTPGIGRGTAEKVPVGVAESWMFGICGVGSCP